MPQAVLQALTAHLEREAAIGAYEAEDEASRGERDVRAAGPGGGRSRQEHGHRRDATVAFSQALSAFDFRPGDRIVTTRADYPSNQLTYLSARSPRGCRTVRADDLPRAASMRRACAGLASHPARGWSR